MQYCQGRSPSVHGSAVPTDETARDLRNAPNVGWFKHPAGHPSVGPGIHRSQTRAAEPPICNDPALSTLDSFIQSQKVVVTVDSAGRVTGVRRCSVSASRGSGVRPTPFLHHLFQAGSENVGRHSAENFANRARTRPGEKQSEAKWGALVHPFGLQAAAPNGVIAYPHSPNTHSAASVMTPRTR